MKNGSSLITIFHLRVEVGEHSSRTWGKSWVLQNCDLDDNLHNYDHANSNRRTAFLESPCAWLEPYVRIPQKTRVDPLWPSYNGPV
jgi:hypothetical protein